MHLEAVRALRLPPVEHRYAAKDSILYALGLGVGGDPTDPEQLKYVYEDGQQVLPSISVVLAHPGFWMQRPELGIDWLKLLHGEQSFEIHKPIPTAGAVRGEYEVFAVEDRGPERGAIMHQAKRLYDVASGELLATIRGVFVLRGDGGCGSFGEAPEQPSSVPAGEPVASCAIATLPQAALIYRLSGDLNPIHVDPAAAAKAGFKAPILHGLCTLGVATRAAVQTLAGGDPDRIAALRVRFSSPVYPGETIVTEFFRDGPDYRFRARAAERDVVVLDRGSVRLRT